MNLYHPIKANKDYLLIIIKAIKRLAQNSLTNLSFILHHKDNKVWCSLRMYCFAPYVFHHYSGMCIVFQFADGNHQLELA